MKTTSVVQYNVSTYQRSTYRGARRKHRYVVTSLDVLLSVIIIIMTVLATILVQGSIMVEPEVVPTETPKPHVTHIENIQPTVETEISEPKTFTKHGPEEVELEPLPEPEPLTPQEVMTNAMGADVINTELGTLTRYKLPTIYYPGIDFSSFQPWMSYKVIKDKTSAAYKVVSDERMYVDGNGLCRFETDPDTQFTIDGQDDYVIALGTYYKPKGTCGDRWLVVTSTGMYTATTGDEKADVHTDEHHMFSMHADGTCAGIIEWLVDTQKLESMMKRMGSVTYGPVEALQGEILYMYRIS